MMKLLKYLPLVLVLFAMIFLGASFNDTTTSTDTTFRIVAVVLLVAAGAMAAYVTRAGGYSDLAPMAVVWLAVGAIGFCLVVISDELMDPLGIIGASTVIGAGSMVDKVQKDAATTDRSNA